MGWLSSWAQAIIIAVIVSIIIEMILPEGSSKKYIKVVVGVYILFTIVSPVISRFTGKSLAVSDILELEEYINITKEKEVSSNVLQEKNSANIREIYIGNLKADIQNKLKSKGYIVIDIALDVGNDKNYTLNKIFLTISKGEAIEEIEEAQNNTTESIEMVNQINIEISNKEENNMTEKIRKVNLSNAEKKKIKEYLSSVYEINEKNIVIDNEKVTGSP